MKAKVKEESVNVVYNKDARTILETISPDVKISTTITSPPYFDMKDYGAENQVGFGQTYPEYLEDLKTIFQDILQITKDDGSLWIIIDTFKRSGQVVTLPFDLSEKLKEIGWLLQDVIIWKKDKTVPWSNNGFMQRKFEYILFFTKSNKYKSNKDKTRIYDTSQLKRWWVKYPERYNPKGKALDEVWEFPIPIQGSWGDKYIKHFCPLPKEMVATMIQLSTDENDLVLDPFAGSGTVLSESAYMKRNYIGFELNKTYIEMFQTYLDKTLKKNRKEYDSFKNNGQSDFEKTILELRALKYARLLSINIQKQIGLTTSKILVEIVGQSNQKNKLIKVEYQFLDEPNELLIVGFINEFTNKPPFTKFGIEPVFKFLKSKDIDLNDCYGYTQTNTYSYMKKPDFNSDKVNIISKICVDLNENDYL